MRFVTNLFEKYLNFLFVLLLPTQLALHFWPRYALIFGIRVDYLSPAFYFTDVLFITIFILWFLKFNKREILNDFFKYKTYIFFFVIVVILNSLFSTNLLLSVIKWLKVFEIILLTYYAYKRDDLYNNRILSKLFLISISIICVIGLLQTVRGGTFGKLFYVFGERSFNIYTPGIAKINIFGINILRSYSIFPHPNSFAGYLCVSLIFLLLLRNKNKTIIYTLLNVLTFITIIMTFSKSSLIGLLFVGVIYFFGKKFLNPKAIQLLPFLLIIISFLSILFSKPIITNWNVVSKSVTERLELNYISGKMISKKYIFGYGLNTFIPNEVKLSNNVSGVWLLQPVHNVYLLVLVETGIIGLIFIAYILSKLIFYLARNNSMALLGLIFILTTSLFDHYWVTIQQNMLIASVFLGYSLRNSFKK